MRPRRTVVIGMLGTTLDAGRGPSRWDRWRPTVALCRHEDLLIDRLELLFQPQFSELAAQVTADIHDVSPETVVRPVHLDISDPWDLGEVYAGLHDFARSYELAPDREDYLVHITTGSHIAQICLFLLTETRYFPARLIQTSPPGKEKGARGGPGSYAVIDLDLSKYDRIASRFRREQREGLSFLKSGIDTRSAEFNRLIERIERVAIASKAPILLTGPTGAGKSQLARRIYELKKNRREVRGELAEVNCATIRGDAAMSALFGHTKGAFTGAVAPRAGLLKKADGGVLFLDEIGELGGDEQAMLLRAIEEKVFLPLGSDREERSDFQLIAGTNKDLAAAVRAGRFREDLLARINLWTFRLPGLSERLEDVAPNLEYELERTSEQLGVRITMSREAKERFLAFSTSSEAVWSGNFRDFNAAVVRMATLSSGGRIGVDTVAEEIDRLRAAWSALAGPVPLPVRAPALLTDSAPALAPARSSSDLVELVLGDLAADLDRFDRVQLNEVLAACTRARTLSDAGRALFQASRKKKSSSNDADRLRKYLARFGLEWKELRERLDRRLPLA